MERVHPLSMLVLAARVLCRAFEEHTGARTARRPAGLSPPPAAALHPLTLVPTHPRSACLHANFVPGLFTHIHYHKNECERDLYFYYSCRSLLPDFETHTLPPPSPSH